METVIKRSGDALGTGTEIFDVETGENRLKVYIKSKLKVYDVVLVGEACIEREEFCASRFTFTVKKDDTVSFNQGDAVSVKFDNKGIFYGYVFSKSRDKKGLIDVVCYDQMRYMKNRRTYTRGKMSVGEIVRRIGTDYALRVGTVAESTALLGAVAAENVSLLDVVKKACSDTRQLTGERFILYDDFGYLTLKNEEDMAVDTVIDSSQAENFVYTDTIDRGVYNAVEVYTDAKKQNVRLVTVASDESNMAAWGTLILTKKAADAQNTHAEAETLLEEYGKINREIVLKRVKGDERFMPGCSVYVRLTMGDLYIDGYVRLVKAVHRFKKNNYTADIYLDGRMVA